MGKFRSVRRGAIMDGVRTQRGRDKKRFGDELKWVYVWEADKVDGTGTDRWNSHEKGAFLRDKAGAMTTERKQRREGEALLQNGNTGAKRKLGYGREICFWDGNLATAVKRAAEE